MDEEFASPRHLGDINLSSFGGDSPKAIAVLEETDLSYRLLLLSDGEALTPPRIILIKKAAVDRVHAKPP